jgi:MFS family permease
MIRLYLAFVFARIEIMDYLNKSLRILLATNGLILLAGAMLGPIYALFVEEIGGNIIDAGLAGGIFALTAGITTIIAGRYSDKIKESELIIVFGYLLLGIGFFLYTKVNSIQTLFLVQVIIGLGEAIYTPVFDQVYTKHMEEKIIGRAWGLWEGMNYFVVAGGAVIGGFIVHKFGFYTLFYVMTVISILTALYILFLPRKVL